MSLQFKRACKIRNVQERTGFVMAHRVFGASSETPSKDYLFFKKSGILPSYVNKWCELVYKKQCERFRRTA